jgi:hypothetical protein
MEIEAGASVTFTITLPEPVLRFTGISLTPDKAVRMARPPCMSSSSAQAGNVIPNTISPQNTSRIVMHSPVNA